LKEEEPIGKEVFGNMFRKDIYLDLDGTLAVKLYDRRRIGKPIVSMVKATQKARKDGYRVILHTSRGWHRIELIKDWLKMHKIELDGIICAKPIGMYVDDHGVSPETFIERFKK
jgi:hydroxymethylpyrimidine pyrophosphatase-like HAD family hydrolase